MTSRTMTHYANVRIRRGPPVLLNPPVRARTMAGAIAEKAKCTCCPYGYHIDRDFVQYAEDMASANWLKHLREKKKAKKQARKSMDLFLAQQATKQMDQLERNGTNNAKAVNGVDVATAQQTPSDIRPISVYENVAKQRARDVLSPLDRNGALSPMDSVFSDSLEHVMSDFEETYSTSAVKNAQKDYSSDYEASSNNRKKLSIRWKQDGYLSDVGVGNYAIPTRRSGPSGFSTNRDLNLSTDTDAEYAPPSDVFSPRLSDSFSSLSSVTSNAPAVIAKSVARPQHLPVNGHHYEAPAPRPNIEYRGLSGQIAANMESLANALKSPPVLRSANATPNPALNAIREQMSISLNHMRDLEEQVKSIPLLSKRIAGLKEEKVQMMRELEESKLRLESQRLGSNQKHDKSPYSTALAKAFKETSPPKNALSTPPLATSSPRPGEQRPPPPVPPRCASIQRVQEIPQVPPKPPPPRMTRSVTPSQGPWDFHSLRRSGRRTFSLRDEDYVSDSEVALGDRSLDRYEALQRSRKAVQARLQNGGATMFDSINSDSESATKRYEEVRDVKQTSVVREQLAKWRQKENMLRVLSPETTDTECETPKSYMSTFVPKLTREIGTMSQPVILRSEGVGNESVTEQPCHACVRRNALKPITREISVEANCTPPHKPITVETAVNTLPLPAPKPKPCDDCAQLRGQIADLRSRLQVTKITFGTMTEPEPIPPKKEYFEQAVATTPLRLREIGCDAPIQPACQPCEERKAKKFYIVGCNTDLCGRTETGVGTEKTLSYDRGANTEVKKMENSECNTENLPGINAMTSTSSLVFMASGAWTSVGTNTDRVLGISFGITTDPVPELQKGPRVMMLDSACNTDLDLDSLLLSQQLAAVQRPLFCTKETTTEQPAMQCNSMSQTTSSGQIRAVVSCHDAATMMDVACKQDRASATDCLPTNTVECNTEGACFEDAGVNTLGMDIFDSETETVDLISTSDASSGTDHAPTTRTVSALFQLDIKPKAVTSVGVGEDTIEGIVCDHCRRREHSFTRHVGVGTIEQHTDEELRHALPPLEQRKPRSFSLDSSTQADISTPPSIVVCPKCKSPVISEENLAASPVRSRSNSECAQKEELDLSLPAKAKVDFSKPRGTRASNLSRAAATKKLLTDSTESTDSNSNKPKQDFNRGTFMSRSMRVESKKGDSLAYITEKRGSTVSSKPTPSATGSVPKTGLKGKVEIKRVMKKPEEKQPVTPTKIAKSRTSPSLSKADSKTILPDSGEAAEAEDTLAPLASEMQRSWSGGAAYENPVALQEEDSPRKDGRLVADMAENLPVSNGGDSTSNEDSATSESEDSISEGSYDTEGNISAKCDILLPRTKFEMSEQLKEACTVLSGHLMGHKTVAGQEKVKWAEQYLQHEWLKAAARKNAQPSYVEDFLDALDRYSRPLMQKVVNMVDQNENTALHYAVSHGNFDVVSLLLDSKVCNVNKPNKAGYTPVMLGALCDVETETDKVVIQRLFQMGDVNIKASQHGQTALMLAVSHGKTEATKMLVDAGAAVNIQDEDGSTALMCAAEHGQKDIVRLLLAHPEVDASLADFDGSTALAIAVENGHRDIGVLIYAHLNYAKGGLASPMVSRKTFPTAAGVMRTRDEGMQC